MTPWVQLLLTLLTTSSSPEGGSWSYVCNNGSCLRNDSELMMSVPLKSKSLDICRMTCSPYGTLWPRPAGSTSLSDNVVLFHPSRISFNLHDVAGRESAFKMAPSREFIHKATQNFLAVLMQTCTNDLCYQQDTIINVKISTDIPEVDLQSNTDESYTLQIVTLPGQLVDVHISAKTVFGARHGLETLSQLISSYRLNSKYYLVIMGSASISDWPAYAHRGTMLDTAGHFIPVPMVKNVLDAMSMNKLNVFHWHASDASSFPLDLPSAPELARYGAYSDEEVYSKDDIEEIVSYARNRGIRVLLEVDMPGRSNSGWQWGATKSDGELVSCTNTQPWREHCLLPPCGQLNPVNPNTYSLVRKIYWDLIRFIPPSDMFHLGGDEVQASCWRASKEIYQWMVEKNKPFTEDDYYQLWTMFLKNASAIFDEEMGHSGTKLIVWSSNLTDPDQIKLDSYRYIIQVTSTAIINTTDKLVSKGYKVILTPDSWQLSHRASGEHSQSSWESVYEENFPPPSDNVLRGEVLLWTNDIDENNLEQRLWPRAAAAAERLWTNPSSSSDIEMRFLQHRERMVNRGIRTETVNGHWCLQRGRECHD